MPQFLQSLYRDFSIKMFSCSPTDSKIVMRSLALPPSKPNSLVSLAVSRIPCFTYRRDFLPLDDGSSTSDAGWGCMLRSGQMLLASALLDVAARSHTWQVVDCVSPATRDILLALFADHPQCPFGIHSIVRAGSRYGVKPGSWFAPTPLALALRDLVQAIRPLGLTAVVARDAHIAREDVLNAIQQKKEVKMSVSVKKLGESAQRDWDEMDKKAKEAAQKAKDKDDDDASLIFDADVPVMKKAPKEEKEEEKEKEEDKEVEIKSEPAAKGTQSDLTSDDSKSYLVLEEGSYPDDDDDLILDEAKEERKVDDKEESKKKEQKEDPKTAEDKKKEKIEEKQEERKGDDADADADKAAQEDYSQPFLLLVPLRLGIEKIDAVYQEPLLHLFRLPQFVGVCGGKPQMSLFFYGCQESRLCFHDPHRTQPFVSPTTPLKDEDRESLTFSKIFCTECTELDPSLVLGFLFFSLREFDTQFVPLFDPANPQGLSQLFTISQKHVDFASVQSAKSLKVISLDSKKEIPKPGTTVEDDFYVI